MMLQTAENGRIRSAENGRFCRRWQTETASKLPRAFLQNFLETTASVFGKMTQHPRNSQKKWSSLPQKVR